MIKFKFCFAILFGIFLINFVISASCFPDYECGDWSGCVDSLTTRTCKDLKCGSEDIIERQFCDKQECNPDIVCEEWSGCNFFDKTNDILAEETVFEGTRERVCNDRLGCVDSFIDTEGCSLAVPIKVRRTEWCGEQLVEILDEKGGVVGRVKQKEITQQFRRVDISLVEENLPTYCSYCSDEEKNYDEEDVDCGGPSCPACVPKVDFFDWAFYASLLSWGIFGLSFFIGLIVFSRNNGFGESLKGIFSFFKPLSKEEALAREERIKEFISPKKISSEGFKNY